MIEFLDHQERRHLQNGRDISGAPLPLPPAERLSLAELCAAHPALHPPVVDGLLREGEVANIISHSKVGKSWLGYSLALSVISGRPWLDRFATQTGKVLLIDNELHRPTLAHRIPLVGDALGFAREWYDVDLEIVSLRGALRGWGDVQRDLHDVQPGEFKLIVFDAKYRFAAAGVSENDNAAETAVYNVVDAIAAQTRAAVVLIHHTTKGGQGDKRVTDVGAGAGAQSRAADCHLVLREHEDEGCVVLDAAVRSFAPVEPLVLRWEFPLWIPEDGADPGRLRGKLTANEQRQGDRDRDATGQVVAALLEGPATARELRRRTGMSRERLDRLVDKLLADGHAKAGTVEIKGRQYEHFSLAEDTE